jgi:MoaA/NifB/PqqE/SkfB family radical SAM enzyme
MNDLIAKSVGAIQANLYSRFGSNSFARSIYGNRLFRRFINFIVGDFLTGGIYQVEITSVCNAKCIFCSYPKIANDKASLLNISDENFERFLEFARKSKKKKIHFVPLVGENFVNKSWAKYMETVLKEPHVSSVKMVTNGILMNKENIDRLLKLSNIDKLSIEISVGGSDADTYLFMYGVDRFNMVKGNVSYLLESLKAAKRKVSVSIEFRIPEIQDFDVSKAKNEFNPSGYDNFFVNALDTFDGLNKMSQAEEKKLKIMPIDEAKPHPCRLLNNILFRSNGVISLCGCVASTGQLGEDLIVGDVKNYQYDEVLARQKKVIDNWKAGRSLPKSCRTCSLYSPN